MNFIMSVGKLKDGIGYDVEKGNRGVKEASYVEDGNHEKLSISSTATLHL